MKSAKKRLPEYLKITLHPDNSYNIVTDLLRQHKLHTVCEEAMCPNRFECFSKKTATFLILGNNCTRQCSFCNVEWLEPKPVDTEEPEKIVKLVTKLGLEYVVITSVTRDDLADGGASHFAAVIKKLKSNNSSIFVEVLVPDFQGNIEALKSVVSPQPDVINHNLETVQRLYTKVRPQALYERSLQLLKNVKDLSQKIKTKSGIMLGLGEKKDEVLSLLEDLRNVDCDFLTIGQYLRPSKKNHPVIEYIEPDTFNEYAEIAYKMGFKYVASAPLVRSSYNAKEVVDIIKNKE